MILPITRYKKYFTRLLILGLLPVFLFLLHTSAPSAAAQSRVIFSLTDKADLQSLSVEYHLVNIKALYSNDALGNIYTADLPKKQESSFAKNSKVKYAEQDAKVASSDLIVTPIPTTNDPYFTTDPTLENSQWYLPKIQVPQAWNYTKGSANVKVAVIDTGIHASHIDLNDGRIIAGFDVTKNQDIAAGADSDDNGHGTIVAGVIGAIPNNQKGLAGINWNVSIMPVKALDASGSGDISMISAGITWAADHGANIINLSLGGSGFPNNITMANAISYAYNKGILIVAAAGNDTAAEGLNLDTDPVYPVCADNGHNMVLGVAASDINDRKATFSNFGINCVDITAPGKKIISTAFLPSDPSNNILIYASGTSLSAPVVSGVAALVKAENPSLTSTQIRDLILKTADSIDSLNQDNCLGSSCAGFLGKGRINALHAVQPQPILNGSLVREQSTGRVYLISGGVKQYVSAFVLSQRYIGQAIVDESNNQLANYTMGTAILPLQGTLIKSQTDSTVYYVDSNIIRPLTYLVFLSRKFSFANVQVIPDLDLGALPKGDWYWPPDATLVLIKGNPTVYVMDKQVARPVTYFVFTQRKLSFAKVVTVTNDEFSHVPRPADAYWLAPLDGTLVKSSTDATVYVIENAAKHALSAAAFKARRYSFANIKTLPQAEMDVIAPGEPIL